MDHGKVVKSKSSSTALTSKANNNNNNKIPDNYRGAGASPKRKSWSSAEFQEALAKKRGVYVEKKATYIINTRQVHEETPKVQRPNRRARRQEKPFLKSILNILSQDTAATQYPDAEVKPKPKKLRRKPCVETVDKGIQDLDAPAYNSNSTEQKPPTGRPKKQRFKSRVLNESIDDRLVILKPKRAISHSISNNSGSINIENMKKWSDFKGFEKKDDVPIKVAMEKYKDECKKLMKAKVLRIEEPSTLVSQYNNKDKSLYNFFVELLETTFSVYNVHAEYNDKNKPSEIKMELDEKVVKKLNLPEIKDSTQEFTDSNYKRDNVFAVTDDEILTDKIQVYKVKPEYTNMNPPILKTRRQRSNFRNTIGSSSFSYNQTHRSHSPMTQSFILPKKSIHKKNKKQTLLNILKEELKMEDDAFEEPQTMHEALQLIAKNKRRCRRAIRFDIDMPDKERTAIGGQPDCMFKRRKVISSSTKSTKKNKKYYLYNPPKTSQNSIRTSGLPRYSITDYATDAKTTDYGFLHHTSDTDSYHSLEVTAYEYEPDDLPPRKMHVENQICNSNSIQSLKTESIESSKNFECQNTASLYNFDCISNLLLRETLDF